MPTIDWDKWHLGWAAGLPKNEMWAKIRNGKNDASGEPTFVYSERADKSSADPKVADVIAEHRFVVPPVSDPNLHSCFCGWVGDDHSEHLLAKVKEFDDPNPVEGSRKKSVRKSAEVKDS